jgi:hypothetical protein
MVASPSVASVQVAPEMTLSLIDSVVSAVTVGSTSVAVAAISIYLLELY